MPEVIDSEKYGYLNAQKLVFQNSIFKSTGFIKGSKTQLKSARQHFYATVPLTSNKLSCVSCLILGFEMLGQLFNWLMAEHKHSYHN